MNPNPSETGMPEYDFLNNFEDISPNNDPNGVLSKPYHRFIIITERNSSRYFPSDFGNHGNCPREPAPRKVVNFWKLCGPHMSHLTLQNIYIQNQQSLVKLLNALLFETCPSLKTLALEPSSYYDEKVAIYNEAEDHVLPKYKSSLLTSFSFRMKEKHPAFNDWNLKDNLKAVFGLMPSLTELTLEGNPVKMIKGLRYPVTISGDFIKLQKLSFFGYGCSAFLNLREYARRANPPLTLLTASISYATDLGVPHYPAFFSFFKRRATQLIQLTLKIEFEKGSILPYFLLLSQPEFNFTNLTDFHVIFENDFSNVAFDFRLMRRMPQLQKFICETNVFNGQLKRNLYCLRNFVSTETVLDPDTSRSDCFTKYFEYPISLNANPDPPADQLQDPIDLGNLTQFSFLLNYKFGEYAIQQLKSWAKKLKILEIVVDDEEDFLDFLGSEFKWWWGSLDKIVLYCEKNLEDNEPIKRAIRGEENRQVEIEFVRLAVGLERIGIR